MSGISRWATTACGALSLAVCAGAARADSTTVYYPNPAHPTLSIVVPEGWKTQTLEKRGDFVTVVGPTGMSLSMRSYSDKDGGLEAAKKESIAWLSTHYTDVAAPSPASAVSQAGFKGMAMGLTAKEKQGGRNVVIVSELLELPNSAIADIQIVIVPGNAEDSATIDAIMTTLKTY